MSGVKSNLPRGLPLSLIAGAQVRTQQTTILKE